jgi:hypothetical protein
MQNPFRPSPRETTEAMVRNIGRELANQCIGHRQDDNVHPIQGIRNRATCDAQLVLEPLTARLTHFNVTNLVGRTHQIL